MKKQLTAWAVAFFMVCSMNTSFAQGLSAEGLLDKAVSLAQSGGNQSELASVLSLGSAALTKEASAAGSNSGLASKLLGQVGSLNSIASLAGSGNAQLGAITKLANTAKVLVAANRISSIIGGGKSNILTNAAGLTSNLGLLQAGSSVLGGSSSNLLGTLISSATSSIGKFGNKGFLGIGGGKCAAGSASKSLGKIVSLVGSSL